MEDKKGYGKGRRNEGYKGASKGGWSTGSRSSKATDSRGTGTADARGGRPAEYKGPGNLGARGDRPMDSRGAGSADVRGGRSMDPRGSRNADTHDSRSTDRSGSGISNDRYGKSAASRGAGASKDRFGKFAESRGSEAFNNRYGKSAESRGSRTADFRSGRPTDSRNPIATDFRGGRPADDAYGKPKTSPFDKPAEGRGSRLDTRSSGLDTRGSRPDTNPMLDEFSANQGDLDKLEGRNSVLEALKSGRSINRIFVAKGDREGSVNQIIAMARECHILVQEIDRSKLDEMSLTHAHQGVIALTAAKDYVEVDDILANAAESGRPPFIIILDEITDSHNLGSILRTANAAGVHGVIIPKRRAIGLTSVVSKASAGAIEYVPVARVTNIVQTIESLKKQNIWVVGTDSTGDKSYYDRDLTGPIALVIGSEGEGMGKLVRESCDFVVNIPMMGQISSLNAAVAGAVVTYEIVRQRSKKQP